MTDGGYFLAQYLQPLELILAREDVTDIYLNRPGEVWVETLGGAIERHAVPQLNSATLDRLARQIAAASDQGVNREHPLLAATLPDGSRIQIVMPPATRGDMAFSIRRHIASDMSIDDYVAAGAFDEIRELGEHWTVKAQLKEHASAKDFTTLLKAAVHARCNIVIAGGTSTGKTTFLNALLGEVDPSERLILIEDTPEVRIIHENAVGLIASRSDLGEAAVTMDDLVSAALRMRPDRIILGELRGPEAFTFLRAVNTGHPGSMTTVHADSPERAIEQIALLILQSGVRLDRADIRHYVKQSVDVFVQLSRVAGRRFVSAIDVVD